MTGRDEDGSRPDRCALLVGLARSAIETELGLRVEPRRAPAGSLAEFQQPAATFVTLWLDGHLRGCIGSLDARRALGDDVTTNARAAAFEDPRFPPLTTDELSGLRIEVSVLSDLETMECGSEAEFLAALRPGVDGLVLECGSHRSTFLPQVWDELPDPLDFLAALKRKARLEEDFWSDEVRLSRYEVESYTDAD